MRKHDVIRGYDAMHFREVDRDLFSTQRSQNNPKRVFGIVAGGLMCEAQSRCKSGQIDGKGEVVRQCA